MRKRKLTSLITQENIMVYDFSIDIYVLCKIIQNYFKCQLLIPLNDSFLIFNKCQS